MLSCSILFIFYFSSYFCSLKKEGFDFVYDGSGFCSLEVWLTLEDKTIREWGLNTAISCSVMLFLLPLDKVSLKSFHLFYFYSSYSTSFWSNISSILEFSKLLWFLLLEFCWLIISWSIYLFLRERSMTCLINPSNYLLWPFYYPSWQFINLITSSHRYI